MAETRIKIARLEQEFDSLNSVMKSGKVKAGDTIQLLTDVVIDELTVVDKNCFIDLCDHFIFVTLAGGLTVKGGVSVTFDNGSIQTLSDTQIEDAIISQGSKTSVALGPHLYVETNGTAIHARKRGGVIIDGTVIKTIGDQCAIFVDDVFSNVEINDGIVTSFLNSALSVRSGGSAVIHGGTLSTDASPSIPEEIRPAVTVGGDQSKVTVDGGSIFARDSVAIKEYAGGSVEVNGGEIFNKNSKWPAVELSDDFTSFKMTDGNLYSTGSYAFMANFTEVGSVQVLEVSGGKVGAEGDIVLTADKGDHGVVFSGGFVKGNLKSNYLKEGYVVSDIKDDEGYAEIIVKTWEDDENTVDTDDSEPSIKEVATTPDFLPQSPEGYTTVSVDIISEDFTELPDSPEEVTSTIQEETQEYDPAEVTHNHDALTNTSVVIRNKIYIYRVPSKQFKMTEWQGVLNIIECKYYGSDGDEFAFVRFKLPGSGKLSTGFVLVSDITD